MSNKLILEIFIMFWLAAIIMWAPTADATAVCQSYDDPTFYITVPGYDCPPGFFLIDAY